MSEIDTYEIRRQIRKYNDLGASEIIDLCAALDEAREEWRGWKSECAIATAHAARHAVRAEKAEATIARVEAAIDIATFDDDRLEYLINAVRTALDGEVS